MSHRSARSLPLALLALLWLAPACGGTTGQNDPPDATPSPADAAVPSGEWATLIDGEWTLSAGSEDYLCVRYTVPQDLFISEFRAIVPLGTHHSVLTVGQPSGPDGITSCTSFSNQPAMIYGAGINTDPIALPEGVAMRVRAGQQLLLNLHLFNASDAVLSGLSGVEMKTMAAEEVVHEAEVLLMGPLLDLRIPPGISTQSGQCTMNGDVTLFMISPHLHQLGTHMRAVAVRDGQEDVVLFDQPYDFEDQQVHPIEPIEMALGDRVEVHCTYNNTTGSTVSWGESSDEEMCFATTYRYPAYGGGISIVCAN